MGRIRRGWRLGRALPAAVLALALLLPGCASIPLSTAMRLASMGPAALVKTDPLHLRVKVSVPEDFELDVEKARLAMEIQAEDGEALSGEMALRLLQRESGTRPGGLFRPDIPVGTYFLALTEEGVAQLREMQQFAVPGRRYEANLSVSTPFSRMPANPEVVTLWIDLQLDPGEAYFPLIDRARITLDDETAG